MWRPPLSVGHRLVSSVVGLDGLGEAVWDWTHVLYRLTTTAAARCPRLLAFARQDRVAEHSGFTLADVYAGCCWADEIKIRGLVGCVLERL